MDDDDEMPWVHLRARLGSLCRLVSYAYMIWLWYGSRKLQSGSHLLFFFLVLQWQNIDSHIAGNFLGTKSDIADGSLRR